MNTNDLKQYLKYVMTLEARVYEMKCIYNKLSEKIDICNNRSYTSYESKNKLEISEYGGLIFSIPLLGAIIGFIVGICVGISKETGFWLSKFLTSNPKYAGYGALWGAGIGVVISIIIVLFDIISVISGNKKIKQYNIQVSKNNEIMLEQDNKKVQIYRREQQIIQRQYNETCDTLKKAYQLNILYPKYRNNIAVCSLFEYLDSGICTQLEGHEGGYAIFELHIRLDRIILKLDEIISNLEKIKENQYVLYSQLRICNGNINRISKQIEGVSDRLGNIEQDQQLIEYNTNITRGNAEFMKWYTILIDKSV